MLKVIRTQADHEAALARVDELMDAKAGTPEGDELEVLATLVEKYEETTFPIDLPDPIEAIKFRMEQAGLTRADLKPILGSRGKVSEVLSRKRKLSLRMIRELHKQLGIPAEVLLQEPGRDLPAEPAAGGWDRFPLAEMVRRGWFPEFGRDPRVAKEYGEEMVRSLLTPLRQEGLQPVLTRQCVRKGSSASDYALLAWTAKVVDIARKRPAPTYRRGTLSEEFLGFLRGLSVLDEGPRVARDYLLKAGVRLVVLRHMPRTHLDGAATLLGSGAPVVALTLRHDRLDHFWFSLFHELSHVILHLEGKAPECFLDDLTKRSSGREEREADQLATDALIPAGRWGKWRSRRAPSARDVVAFAESLRIHPSIVAGRVRRSLDNYRILSNLVGSRKVRMLFAEEMSI